MFDYLVFEKINSLAGKYPVLDAMAIFFAKYFDYFLIFIVFLFLLKNFKKYWRPVVKTVSAGVLARLGFTEIIRFFYKRPRPFVENKVNLLFNHSSSSSFPSGHAAFYFAVSIIIYSYNKKAGYLFFIASFLISLSRVFVGIHWPSDILGGAIVGIISGIIILKLFSKKS
jgi:undecaprenyl-diphosphatase